MLDIGGPILPGGRNIRHSGLPVAILSRRKGRNRQQMENRCAATSDIRRSAIKLSEASPHGNRSIRHYPLSHTSPA